MAFKNKIMATVQKFKDTILIFTWLLSEFFLTCCMELLFDVLP